MASYSSSRGVSLPSQYERAVGNARVDGDFFSAPNVERLHGALVGRVHQRTGGKAKIDRQSDEDLRALMLDLYDPRLDVAQLNGLVVERATEIVLGNLASYLAYLGELASQRPQSAVSRVLERPQPTRADRSAGVARPVF